MNQERRNTCPSRYLTADGAILRCALPHGPVSADPPKIHTDAFMDTPGRGLNWRPDDPCEWDATVEGEDVPARLSGDDLLVWCDSLLSLALHRGEGAHVPEWKAEAERCLAELRSATKEV